MDIDLREPVRLGESTQWIRIRAANARNPLLLLVQMGPGPAGDQNMTQALCRAVGAHSPLAGRTGGAHLRPAIPRSTVGEVCCDDGI